MIEGHVDMLDSISNTERTKIGPDRVLDCESKSVEALNDLLFFLLLEIACLC